MDTLILTEILQHSVMFAGLVNIREQATQRVPHVQLDNMITMSQLCLHRQVHHV
jgi:hypothetical protein